MTKTPTVSEAVLRNKRVAQAFIISQEINQFIHQKLDPLDDFARVLACHEIEIYVHKVELTIRQNHKEE